jgi:hypothetical protein
LVAVGGGLAAVEAGAATGGAAEALTLERATISSTGRRQYLQSRAAALISAPQ